jgi:hypothetical protein
MKGEMMIKHAARLTCVLAVMMMMMCLTAEAQTPPFDPVDPRGGTVIRLDNFNLWESGAYWSLNGTVSMLYEAGTPHGCYRMRINSSSGFHMAQSGRNFPVKRNRNYICSMLINCDYVRDDHEINAGMRTTGDGQSLLYNLNGLPSDTNGWTRWEYQFTSNISLEGENLSGPASQLNGYFYMRPFKFASGYYDVRIADVAFVELPAEPLVPFAKGEGVTFRGGKGNLPMAVEEVSTETDKLKVRTTGATYVFNMADDTITACQMIGRKREVAVFQSTVSLANLEILQQDEDVCVIANNSITFGVQCDGLLVVSPQQELAMLATGSIGGEWNRLITGHMLLVDDFGGLSVNPHIPLGTGRLPRFSKVTGELDEPGWQVYWQISPGERLGISVFPPREYPWEKSFEFAYELTFPGVSLTNYSKWAQVLDSVLLWNTFYYSGFGMSWGPEYVVEDESDYRRHIGIIQTAGMKAMTYMSPYFYYVHDPEVFMQEVERMRDTYGLDGVYYDGVYSQDWIKAYECMRMTREAFPDGTIILHTTGQGGNGGPPLARHDIFIPVIDTYTTATLRGEYVLYTGGKDWQYPKYITSQYRKANCIGLLKGDRWQNVTQNEQDLLHLRYNGRARANGLPSGTWTPGTPTGEDFVDIYYPTWMELKQLWQDKGDLPYFYDEYYKPKAYELTRPILEPGDTSAAVMKRWMFYNDSFHDGQDAGAGPLDDQAIAYDKVPLYPGIPAIFDNYSSYEAGVNGIMIDVARLAGTPTLDDFEFRMGNGDDPSMWSVAPDPTITHRPGDGLFGSDRLTLIWPEATITGQWLQVTMKPTAATGLSESDVFYFGNAIGESGDSQGVCGGKAADAYVNVTDQIAPTDAPATLADPASADNPLDFNRDGLVNMTDVVIARRYATDFANSLKLITPPE